MRYQLWGFAYWNGSCDLNYRGGNGGADHSARSWGLRLAAGYAP